MAGALVKSQKFNAAYYYYITYITFRYSRKISPGLTKIQLMIKSDFELGLIMGNSYGCTRTYITLWYTGIQALNITCSVVGTSLAFYCSSSSSSRSSSGSSSSKVVVPVVVVVIK